jgi:DNA repair exonuclease SbcCD ATPase subunit
MKFFAALLAVRLGLLVSVDSAVANDRPITKVVKLLQEMLDTSTADGDNERTLYGKYKCYCDTNKAEKTESIESLTQAIATLENELDELQSRNGELSRHSKKLVEDMAANEQSRADALSLRNEEEQAFFAMSNDSATAIAQMEDAIKELASVGADQTAATAADHQQFMAGYKSGNSALLSVRNSVRRAMLAATSTATSKQAAAVASFLEEPFTATYTSQAGEVVGILKNMIDTFTSNLESARVEEEQAAKAFKLFTDLKEDEFRTMSKSNDDAQAELIDNDSQLSTKETQLSVAKSSKASDETFLASLTEMCAAKAEQYKQRTLLRRNEEAALSEAISILNSDAAFQAFGHVDATKTGAVSLFQHRSIHLHAGDSVASSATTEQARTLLRRAGKKTGSLALTRIAALLEAHNPFTVVLQEISKMISLIGDEQEADEKKKEWCEQERTTNNQELQNRNQEIEQLKSQITRLNDEINHETTGLITQISGTETDIASNREAQTTQTSSRKEANAEYQEDIAHLVEAEKLLNRAVAVLQAYYSKIVPADEASFAQEEPEPPSTWDDKYVGQSSKGGSAIEMLTFILKNTKDEETEAHKTEAQEQDEYETSMSSLKSEEKKLMGDLSVLQENLAVAKKQLLETKDEHKTTVAQKEAIEAYLAQIKSGCDFITNNFDTRSSNRVNEKKALEDASTLLKGTPVYQTAVAAQHNETLGDCLSRCAGAEDNVECKACRAKVTIPGYCAGHPETEGC